MAVLAANAGVHSAGRGDDRHSARDLHRIDFAARHRSPHQLELDA